MQVRIASSISEFDAREWNRLAGDRYPFLRHEFLEAAERSGSVTEATGWTPRHVGLLDQSGKLRAALPLYEKTHSWGEFVFDWSWAQAYQQNGFDYYPKLVSTIPFTPATSRKLLTDDPALAVELLDSAREFAVAEGHSSIHVLFPEQSELAVLQECGLKIRKDCQFHWHNNEYRDFDEFLGTFSSSKRKKARRDRRRVAEQDISFRHLTGRDIDTAMWRDIYELISITFLRRGSMPYFSFTFFLDVSAQLADNLLVVLAEKGDVPVAAAIFYDSPETLYGRYWGADARYDALHFETCYYQGIDYCIKHGRAKFEPGTQGEHKISRGFIPVTTWSAHWLERPEFFSAVEQFLRAEGRHVDSYIDAVNEHSPYKSPGSPADSETQS